jgi:hypothetical protein
MRFCLCILALAAFSASAASAYGEMLRGRLVVNAGKPAVIETADQRQVRLDGDEDTRKVLQDPRLNGFEIEAQGRFTAPGQFLIDPIHTRAMMAHQDGKLKMITYFCDVCNIRTNVPGSCVCCQRETTLELRDPGER